MGRTLAEQKVLKKLGIPDFRHMTKDKIVTFATMLPKMDPEVAKKALEQFPEFTDAAKEIVSYYKEVIFKGFDVNSESVDSFYLTCDAIVETLKQQLQNERLTFEQKQIIIDKMIVLAQMKSEKDSENKKFILDTIKTVGGYVSAIGGAIAAGYVVLMQLGKVESDGERYCEDESNIVDSL
ncbi:MAG: hypothetical protein IJX04_04435 [Oscillospiraceae bacterium]|nr:hypothetical protein [Oscillospiraceae bacterium]